MNHNPANDNIAWPDYGKSDTPQGDQINVIAEDIDPVVARNVALYYEAKDEPWANAMGARLRSAARSAASRGEFRKAA